MRGLGAKEGLDEVLPPPIPHLDWVNQGEHGEAMFGWNQLISKKEGERRWQSQPEISLVPVMPSRNLRKISGTPRAGKGPACERPGKFARVVEVQLANLRKAKCRPRR